MIDPVTNTQLNVIWKPVNEMPSLSEYNRNNGGFECLVLLDTREYPHISRIQAAMYCNNVVTIGGLFSFDQPPVVALMNKPPII